MSRIPLAPSTPHTDAVMAALAAAQILAGRAEKPSGGGWQSEPAESSYVPYAVVYPYPGIPDGSVAEPLAYLDYTALINVFGADEIQCEVATDMVAAALVGRRLPVEGRSTYPVQSGSGSPARPNQAVPTPIFMSALEISFRSQAR